MASYIVVVHARDRIRAQEIVKAYESGDAGTTVGMYLLESRFDDVCPGLTCTDSGRKTNGWTRDGTGRVVHACGRPHRDWRKRIAVTLMDLFGRNMYSKAPSLFRNERRTSSL